MNKKQDICNKYLLINFSYSCFLSLWICWNSVLRKSPSLTYHCIYTAWNHAHFLSSTAKQLSGDLEEGNSRAMKMYSKMLTGPCNSNVTLSLSVFHLYFLCGDALKEKNKQRSGDANFHIRTIVKCLSFTTRVDFFRGSDNNRVLTHCRRVASRVCQPCMWQHIGANSSHYIFNVRGEWIVVFLYYNMRNNSFQ